MTTPLPHTIDSVPKRPKNVARPIFDRGQNQSPEDEDSHAFDAMREDEGALDEDHSLNDGSSAMSDQPSNGPGNRFTDRFSE